MAATAARAPAADPAYADLFAYLAEINGQDFLDARAAAVGKLSTAHYLRLPRGFTITNTSPDEIGTPAAAARVSDLQLAQIYAMNKAVFEGEEAQIKGALLRTQMVVAGWCTGTYEVTIEDPPADAIAIMYRDFERIKEFMDDARKLAMLLPLAAEHTFRTMGHHYITGLAADYNVKYARFFTACTQPGLNAFLPPEILFHRAAHWVPLSLSLAVARSPTQAVILPNAVVIRSRAGPAGTALVSTSVAILNAISGTGLLQEFERASGVRMSVLTAIAQKIADDPGAFHVIAAAYGRPILDNVRKRELDDAIAISARVAPVLQGFLDALPRTSDLSMAKSLIKHAELNPLLRRRAKAYFSEVGKAKATSMQSLFSMDTRSPTAIAASDEVEDEV